MEDFRKLWVLELESKGSSYGFIACEGDSDRRRLWKRMKEARAKYPQDKFRVVKYVPEAKS